jgi:tetratricopeptide (TPR) repeat protein
VTLRRLSAKSREHVRVLAVCQGGIQLAILGMLTGLEPDAARKLAVELIEVGLGEAMDYGHLRLNPGLPPYLLGELTADEAESLRARWAEAMAELTGNLYQEQFKDARLAAQLTLLELPNLLEMLSWTQGRWMPERVVVLAASVEKLMTNLGRPVALARATKVREQAAQTLGDWSHARYIAEDASIARLIGCDDLTAACAATRELLEKSLAAGEAAYPEAAYDIAETHWLLGRVLNALGATEDALAPLAEARRRFQNLVNAGDKGAERMASVALVETGKCLFNLGRLEAAANAFEQAHEVDQRESRSRDVAAGKLELGTVRLHQKRYREALELYAESREAFENLGEPRQVAAVWHQIGMAHQEEGHFELAELAYRQALRTSVRENDFGGQADALNQLGIVYGRMGRLEEGVTFTKHAAEIYQRLGYRAHEGRFRSNLAGGLIRLYRYDEARRELQQSIECGQPYGHAAQPWKSWGLLEVLEHTTGHFEAAQAARQQAIETYLAYRRADGVSQSPCTRLFTMVAQATRQNTEGETREVLDQLAANPDAQPFFKALIARLQLILAGDRNPALADNPELVFVDAAELQLLLEALGQDHPKGGRSRGRV